MAKKLTLFSQYKAPQGYWIDETNQVWIKPEKSHIEEEVFHKLLKKCEAFRNEIESEDSKIMVHTAKQEAKAEKQDAKLLKEIEDLKKKLATEEAKVKAFENRPKPGPKPAPKPQGKPS